jgi:FMN phosphatase YigB (HAD superfamily)
MPSQKVLAPQPGIGAVLFDAYGTLFDVYSVALLAVYHHPRVQWEV